MHTDNAYLFKTILYSNKAELSKQESWLLASLSELHLLGKNEIAEKFSKLLLDKLCASEAIEGLERVCLARKLGISNQIQVLSSSNNKTANSMPSDYSCFISHSGSLSGLKQGNLRAFADADFVIKSFEKEAKPVQRSISRIQKMGFQSGFCLPLNHANHTVGYLFFNSLKKIDDFSSESLGVIISYCSLLGKNALLESGWTTDFYLDYAQSLGERHFVGKRFHPDDLKHCIQTAYNKFHRSHLEVQFKDCSRWTNFLYSPGNLGYVIAKCLPETSNKQILTIDIDEKSEKLAFVINHSIAGKQRIAGPTITEANCLGMQVDEPSTEDFVVEIAKDEAHRDDTINYSVES